MPRPSSDSDRLSPLEAQVMDIVWRRHEATAEVVQAALAIKLNNATVRTVLRRIEAKGFLTHRLEGRAYVYYPVIAAEAAAQGALKRVLRRFYGGSVEQLVQGLLDGRMIDRRKLEKIARQADEHTNKGKTR
jgi:BlaI family transcriptional regulator, penicillinase repressor